MQFGQRFRILQGAGSAQALSGLVQGRTLSHTAHVFRTARRQRLAGRAARKVTHMLSPLRET